MATSRGHVTHADARDRLMPEVIFSVHPKLTLEKAAEDAARHAYAAYQQALQMRFRGRDYGEAAIARLYWCTCESKLVDMRAGRLKPNEFNPLRWRGER
jgi:hypothetical protein